MRFDDYNFRSRYKKHPLLSNFSEVLPSNIKDLFKWMEFITHNSPTAAAGIKKLSEVPVTNFRYSAVGDKSETTGTNPNSWKTIIEKSLKMKRVLLNVSYNTLVYGNCFVSVYSPIERRCTCLSCKNEWSLLHLKGVKVSVRSKTHNGYSPSEDTYIEKKYGDKKNKQKTDATESLKKKQLKSKLRFDADCPKCKARREFSVTDVQIRSHRDTNVIVWDPNAIQLSSNQVSGKCSYFYTVPALMKDRIKKNDLDFLSTLPLAMIEAALTQKIFKFADGHIHHVKREVISGISTAWGMPALASAIPAFMTLMILRKANETIANDYMVPLRVAYPNQSGSGSDIYNYMGGSTFAENIRKMLHRWKLDPSAVQTAPFGLGVETILGDGKLLTLNQDIDQLESNIANSLGIPIEFIKGGLSYTAQGSSLRLLENQLEKVASSLEEVIEFVVGRLSSSLSKAPIVIEMVPFKIIDDMQEKAAILQLALQGQNSVSRGTVLEMFNMDAVAEKKRIEEDQKDDVKSQVDMQRYTQEVSSSIEEQAANDAQMNNSSFTVLNQQALMTEAQTYVDQLKMMDDGARKSQLDEMSKTNYILYGVVRALLDMTENKQDYAQKMQDKDEQQQG